jgi:glycosyltransferase involved in cell wall biosynthesis
MPRPLVIYWNSQPSPYVVARFNAVIENGNVDLRAWFDKERDSDRSWLVDPTTWKFPATYLPKAQIGSRVLPFPTPAMWSISPNVLITAMDRVAGVVAALAGRAVSDRVASRTLPVYETWVKPTVRAEIANHFLYRAIDGAKTPGREAAAMAQRYGLPSERIWRVTQSVDLDLYKQALSFDMRGIQERKRLLGLHGCTFIYVGRLWKGKGIEYLIDAFRIVQSRHRDVSLLILGDGSDEERLRLCAQGLENVHFVGFVQGSDLPEWYALADVFVFPTLGDPNGLVVEEAMATGLPVISTGNAGDIRTRVRNYETGFVVPAFDAKSLADRMATLCEDEELRRAMSRNALEKSENFAVKHYADDFDAFIAELLEMPPRRTIAAVTSSFIGKGLLKLAKPLGYLS